MKIKLVDKKTAAKKIFTTIALIIALLVVVNYYLNPLVEKQLMETASRIASSQNYNSGQVLAALTTTINDITSKLVYAYIIVAVIRTTINLVDHKLLNLIAGRTLTIAYLAYTYTALNHGIITLSLGENIVTIDVSKLLTTTLTSITLIVAGATIIQAANTIRRTQVNNRVRALRSIEQKRN